MNEKLLDNKAFCVLPWTSMCILSHGEVKTCCISTDVMGNTKSSSLKDIWNNDLYKSLRLDMINGVQNEKCKRCYTREENGGSSMRTIQNKSFIEPEKLLERTDSDGSMKDLKLEWLDVRLSSVCNFKCRTCESTTSSKWADEDIEFGELLPDIMSDSKGFRLLEIDSKYPLLPQIKEVLKSVKMIYFSGGEPLLHPEHYEMLDYLIESGNTDVILKYNSNLSILTFKGKNVIDLWKHFKNVQYFASIDGIGEREEYIRHGAVWKDQVENLDRIRTEAPHVAVAYNLVVSIFNVATLIETIKKIDRLLPINELGENSPHLERLVTPEYFSIKVLDEQTKTETVNKLTKWLDENQNIKKYRLIHKSISDIVEFIKEDHTHLMPRARQEIDKIDARRGESFVKTFPELERFYNLCGNKINE